MSDEGWEARMAARAVQRRRYTAAEERATDPHAGHHHHLRGSSVVCSCGEDFGVTTVALTDTPFELVCDRCGLRGVVRIKDGR